VRQHTTRIHVACANLSEAAGDRRSADLHETLFQGILDSIAGSGDGLTLDSAYVVVSAVEAWEYLVRTGQVIVNFGKPQKAEAAMVLTVRNEFGIEQTLWFVRHAKFAEAFNAKKELALRQMVGIDN
jgi:hypothetical protein